MCTKFLCASAGGAFYTPETIDTARLHYRSSWAPVLHAVALWLSSTEFGAEVEKEEESSASSKSPALPQGASVPVKESVEDRMHLMLGKLKKIICPIIFLCIQQFFCHHLRYSGIMPRKDHSCDITTTCGNQRENCTDNVCIFVCLPGVSIEFLCFPRPEEPIEHVMSCLHALFTLLESPCAKAHIAQDQVKSRHSQ